MNVQIWRLSGRFKGNSKNQKHSHKMKNAFDGRSSRLNTVKERISELDDFDKTHRSQRKLFIKLGCTA